MAPGRWDCAVIISMVSLQIINGLLLTVPSGKLTTVFNQRSSHGSYSNCYLYSSEESGDTFACNIVTEPFLAASYAGLPESDWSKVDGIYPQLIPTVKDYSHYTRVAGTTLLDGAGYSRRVRVLNLANNGLIGDVMTEADGTFALDTTPHKNAVLVMAYDDVGTQAQSRHCLFPRRHCVSLSGEWLSVSLYSGRDN